MEGDRGAAADVVPLVRPRADVQLPSGDLTFVFTDVEGSTRLLSALGDRFATLLAVHQSIVAGAMTQAGGVLVDTEGDALFFACTEADAAVEGILAAQAAMAEYPWPAGYPLRIRAGLHTGPARPIGQTYIALAVHQAARICAAGHGGQVLASATTASLVHRTGTDLGRFRLKDFDEPITIVQYDADEHPPLHVLPEAIRRLVLPDTSFVGREDQLAILAGAFANHRLVTICGPGGTGKTRLAIEHAARAPADTHVAVTELAGARNEAEVVGAVAAALELSQAADQRVLDQVAAHVSGLGAALIVLDNCEQVLEPVGGLVRHLLSMVPGVRLLLTSREPLGAPEERLIRLEPLAPPAPGTPLDRLLSFDAALLLADRILARDPGFRLDQSDAEDVIAICRQLDGSPLGLELVAAEVASIGLSAARASVETGTPLDGGHGRPERHRSITAALDWSYRLLEQTEQLIWQELSVLVAPFRIDDAIHICVGAEVTERDVRAAVAALVRKSIITRVQAEDGDRYRMHQTVREYGVAKLVEAGRLGLVRDRHAGWAENFLDQNYYRITPPNWFVAFEICRDDLVGAWHYLRESGQRERAATVGGNTAYWDYFTSRGAEGTALLEELATWPDGPYLVGPLIQAASVVSRSQDKTRARRLIEQAMRHPMERRVERAAQDTLATVRLEQGDFAAVREHANRVLTEPAPFAAPVSHAGALSVLGIAALCEAELTEARSYSRQALEKYLEIGQAVNACITAVNLASVALLLGDQAEAAALAQQAFTLAETAKVVDEMALARMHIVAARGAGRSSDELRRAVAMLVDSGVALLLGEFYNVLPVLRSLREWRALAVACGAFAAVYRFALHPFPLLDQLLREYAADCAAAITSVEYEVLYERGMAVPTYANILGGIG